MENVVAEEWRPVPGTAYEASTEGRIRGPSGRILKPFFRGGPGGQDYLAVAIYAGSRRSRRKEYVHVMVCLAYHGPKPVWHAVVAHLDEDKKNCRPGNVAWATQSWNMSHWSVRRGRAPRRAFSDDIQGSERQAGDVF